MITYEHCAMLCCKGRTLSILCRHVDLQLVSDMCMLWVSKREHLLTRSSPSIPELFQLLFAVVLWCNVYQPLELQLAGNQVEDEAGELVPVMIKTDTACLDSEPFNQQLDEYFYKCNVHTVAWMRKIEYAVKRVQQKLLVSLSLPLYPANWQKSVSANG